MMWINGYVNSNQIVSETNFSALIKLKGSDFKVWIPKKCIRNGTHCANYNVGIISDKEYEIFKNGKGRWNKFEKTDSRTVTGEDLKDLLFVN